jgi:hypothetical protein
MIHQGSGVFTLCLSLTIATLQPSVGLWLEAWQMPTPEGWPPSNPTKGAYFQHAGILAIDPPGMTGTLGADVPVDYLRWINELPVRGNADISRSMVSSPRPAAAPATCNSNPSRPGAIGDIDQPSHLMVKSMNSFPVAQACPRRAVHNMDING